MPVEISPENTYFSSYDQPLYVTVATSRNITLSAYYDNTLIFQQSLTRGKHYLKIWDTVPASPGVFTIKFTWSGEESGSFEIKCVYYSGYSRLIRFRDEKGASLSCYVSMFDLRHGLVMKLIGPYSGVSVPTAFVADTTYLEVYRRNADGTYYYWIGLARDAPDYLTPAKVNDIFVRLTVDKNAAKYYLRVRLPFFAFLPDSAIDVYLSYAGKWQIASMIIRSLSIGGEIWSVDEDANNIYITLRLHGGPIAEAVIATILFIAKIGVIAMAIYFGLEALSNLIKSIAMVIQPSVFISDNYAQVKKEIAETMQKVTENATLTPDQKERIITALSSALSSIGGLEKEAITAAMPTSTIITIALAALVVGLVLGRGGGRE
ncbi:MAG: hypothetical protein QXF74_05665 [Nitrososphaerota archaeon]